MAAPSRAQVFGEVIQLREQLDALRRANDEDDLDAIRDILAGNDLDDDDEDSDTEDDSLDDDDLYDDEEDD